MKIIMYKEIGPDKISDALWDKLATHIEQNLDNLEIAMTVKNNVSTITKHISMVKHNNYIELEIDNDDNGTYVGLPSFHAVETTQTEKETIVMDADIIYPRIVVMWEFH